jgi:glycosyltransferase involved in cell wall biosynthesis
MNLLYLNYEFPPLGGGGGPVSFEIAERYVQLGHSVDVVTMGFKGLPATEMVQGINIFRVPCIRAKKEICHTHEMLTYVLSAIRFIPSLFKQKKYDACHTHFAIPTGLVAAWVKQKYKLPFIITSHGSDIPGYNNDRFTFAHHFTKPLLKKVLKESSGNFAGSQYLADLGNKNIAPATPFKVIRQGFNSEQFVPQAKEKIILSTGRLLRRKGFQYLIEAVSATDIGYEVHICGDGPMMPELQQLAAKSKTKIVFHGWIDNNSPEYKELIEKAAIYSLVSAKENASKSLLEALSTGCAVITSNIAGCPESVGDAGITIDPENATILRDTIMHLIENPNEMKARGLAARKYVLATYDWAHLMQQYESALKKIAGIA